MIRDWFRKFMVGRYGTDQLGIALIFLSFVLSIVFVFIPETMLRYIVYLPFALFLFRAFSKNVARRREENIKFLKFWGPVASWFRKKQYRLKDRKFNSYYSCPNCKQAIRVPKGKGKIRITCPKCKHEFVKKT